ncbi:MAG: copper-binding protein [Burkholderiaceae bacterium]|jgi:Cu/Ag efflux protein CusF
MKSWMTLSSALMLFVATGLAPVSAAEHEDHHQQEAAADEKVAGEIRKIDLDNRKVTIRHGEMKQLNMGAMTMVFRFADPAMLGELKVGDQVRFVPAKVEGQLMLKMIEKAQ